VTNFKYLTLTLDIQNNQEKMLILPKVISMQ